MPGLFDDVDNLNYALQQLQKPKSNAIGRGSLIAFHYPQSMAAHPNVIHDAYPLVIVADIWPTYLRGVNLHYVTLPMIRDMLNAYGNNQSFTYQTIKLNRALAESFRIYHRNGMGQVKKLDLEFLQMVLKSDGIRSFTPAELERVRQAVEAQIRARLQVQADELTAYEQWRQNAINQQQMRQTTANMPPPMQPPSNLPVTTPQLKQQTLNNNSPASQPPMPEPGMESNI